MPESFIARITPLDMGARPEHPIVIPEPPLGIWGGGNEPFPTPPIYIQIPPGVIPGPPPRPAHPIWLPVFPAHPIVIPPGSIAPGVPTHPIVLPPPPLEIWGGGNVPMPSPPIYLPPDAIAPGVPAHPIYLPPRIWGGANEPFPTHPIFLPPGNPGNPFPPQDPDAVPSPGIAYPIDLYAHVPGLGVIGPITIHYPGPLPGHALPGPQAKTTEGTGAQQERSRR